MILDELLEFLDNVAVNSTTGTVLEGDVIDLGAEPQDLGNGRPMYLVVQVTAAFTSGTASTVAFQLASDSVAAVAVDGSQTIHYTSDAYADSVLTAGTQIVVPLPTGYGTLSPYERYLGLQVVTGAATTTAGSINAFLTFDPKGWKAMPDGAN